MSQDGSDLERRLTEIQSQINRLSLSLHLWRERQDRLAPMEARLSQFTEQCSELVDRWAATGERQAQAVDGLEQRISEFNVVDTRAQQEAVRQLCDQAASLTEAALTAASTAVSGYDRTEARLASMETDLRHTLTDLSGQVQSAVAELSGLTKPRPQAATGQMPAWPLDGVVRLHNQLREVEDGSDPADLPIAPGRDRLQLPEATAALVDRIETLERTITEGQQETAESRFGSAAWAAVVLLAVGLAGAGYFVTRLQGQMDAATARMAAAQQTAEAATQAANRQITAAREDAASQIAEARETALKAQTISDVLAAPDLVRYNLVGRQEGRDVPAPYSAQALWSRSRGLVFSGSRLPPPPVDSTYQIWLLTATDPVSAGTFVPDASGRFTMATTTLAKAPPPLAGISVTVERTGGSDRPTGVTLLARAE